MYFTKSLFLLVIVLGAFEIWSVKGMTYRRIVRPSITTKHNEDSHLEEEKEHHLQHYPQQHPTVKPTYDSSHYHPTSPPDYSQHQPSHSVDYQWQKPPQHSPPTPQTTVVDQYDNRYPDGSYEFKYELSDATVRYECGYFIWFEHKRILAVKGYYSYRLPDHRYHTVFYSADQYGYRQDSASFSLQRPVLPKSLSEGLIRDDGLRNFEESPSDTIENVLVSE